MIEITILDYLDQKLSVPVRMEDDRSYDSLVVLRKSDSTTEDWLTTSTIVVQSFGKTLIEAARLNEEVVSGMLGLQNLDEVSACKLVTDYNLNDTASKRYRYQAVFYVTHY